MSFSTRIFTTFILTAFIAVSQAFAGEPYSYRGTTDSKVMGKQEKLDGMVLNVNETEEGLAVSMTGFQLLGYKDISISGIVTVSAAGEITGYDKVVIKGAPGKVKTVTGKMTKDGAQIRLTGKAAGAFNFDIAYNAKIVK